MPLTTRAFGGISERAVPPSAKSPAACRGAFVSGELPLGSGGAPEQARRDLAIDADKRSEMDRLWIRHRGDGVVHDKQTNVRDVLAKVLRHRVVDVCHFRQEHGPEFAVVEQRLVELSSFLVPAIVHRLQPRRSLEQECCFKLTWV